jgi:hypothetical protein
MGHEKTTIAAPRVLETYFLAVAQTAAFCLASSKMLYLLMGVD